MNRSIRFCVLGLLFAACGLLASPAAAEDNPMDLRVMSFNIRFGTANDGPNSWPHRTELVKQVIKDFNPDLLGGQEVMAFQGKFLREALPDYNYIGVGRADGKEGGELCPVMYRKDRFELLDSGTFWLSETPEVVGSKSWDSSLPRIATWAKLKDRRPGQMLLFCNTHFDHRGPEARLQSARLLQERLPKLADGAPIIVTGDFNCNEDSQPYKVLTKPEAGQGVAFVDSYRVVHPERSDREVTYNGFKPVEQGSRIDWILYSPQQLKPVEAAIVRTQIDGRLPSDHYPATAVLRLIEQPKGN